MPNSKFSLSQERKLISSMRIPTSDLDTIDHSVCVRREDSGLNINIDEDTIKKMLKDASDGVKNIASQVRLGAR